MAIVLHDRFGRDVRLADERITHILGHAEMVGQLDKVEDTVRERMSSSAVNVTPMFTCTISITRRLR